MPSSIQSSHHPLTQSSAQSRIEHGLNCAHEFQTSIYLFIQLSLFVLLTTYLKSQHTREEWCKLNGEGGWENSWKTEGNGWITASAIGKCNLGHWKQSASGRAKGKWNGTSSDEQTTQLHANIYSNSLTKVKPGRKRNIVSGKFDQLALFYLYLSFFFSLLSTFDRSNEADIYFLPQLFQVPHSKT